MTAWGFWLVAATLLWGGLVALMIAGSMVRVVRRLISRIALPLVVLSLLWLSWQFLSMAQAQGLSALWERRGAGPKRLLAVSHLDTVFATGTAKARPFSIAAGERPRAMGPGVLDMKGGIVSWLYALRALHATESRAFRDATLAWFLNTEEEVLSPTSRPLIRMAP